MRLVIQKVKTGQVIFKDKPICEIGRGHIFYIGIETVDTKQDLDKCIEWLIDFIQQTNEDALLLSQFTLFANFKNKKPSFHRAKNTTEAKMMFLILVDSVKKNVKTKVEAGIFGECLDIIYSADSTDIKMLDFNNDKINF